MDIPWELSSSICSLDGQGVRSVCVLPAKDDREEFSLVLGTQGGSLLQVSMPSLELNPIVFQHDHSITALIAAGDVYITGCKDAKIRILSAKDHSLQATLTGHDKPVTSLSLSHDAQFLASGSWDGTAKIWNLRTHALIATLDSHENSVSVEWLHSNKDDDSIVSLATGSAGMAQNNQIRNHTIRIWNIHTQTGQSQLLQQVANDHDGPIRDVLELPDSTIATCSNDGTVKLRSATTATATSTLTTTTTQQQAPILLQLTTNNTCIVASGEDGQVFLWNLQIAADPTVLRHPSCIWNTISLPNGDLAMACQDGHLYIWTQALERQASEAQRQQFHLEAQPKSGGPTPEEIAKLPKWELSSHHVGKSEGQVQVFNKDGVAIAAQWSAVSGTWVEVGQVMGSASDANNNTIEGVQYDHVLPIEVDQSGGGVAQLKIGYNNGENPFVAAQRFIDHHVLPQYHLTDIADYIQQRVGQGPPTLGGGAAATPTTPVATTGVPMIALEFLPATTYKSFELSTKNAATTLDKIKTKLTTPQEETPLSTTQVEQLTAWLEVLADTSHYHSTSLSKPHLELLAHLLEVFPPSHVFPVLDLARMTVLHPSSAAINHAALWEQILDRAIALGSHLDELVDTAAMAVPMLSLRLFCNCFKAGGAPLQALSTRRVELVLNYATPFVTSSNKNIRLSVATLLYNVSVYLSQNNQEAVVVLPLLDTIVSKQYKVYESEAMTRVLLALGTLVVSLPTAKEAAKALFLTSKVELAASSHGDVAKKVAKEVYTVLQ